jgi:hypothetical protein
MDHVDLEIFASAETKTDRAWYRFVAKVEDLTGKPRDSLDGDEGDGFSIDAAYLAFKGGQTPAEHVAEIRVCGSPFAEAK